MYRGAANSSTQIAAALGVRFLLQGSVRKSGAHVRISALLTDAQSNRQIWAERYDRTLDNIFELQSEISNAIVSALKFNLHLSARAQPSHLASTKSGKAYQFYLRGKNLLRRSTLKNNELAQTMFEHALDCDPDYVLAQTALARCL
ncbi:MAG: hypothetical protein COA47_18230 [Robiginitomaculum sp.]|nr:MAG: hypothetical protein COA47_18230 [Robiginitomaculum sp.]